MGHFLVPFLSILILFPVSCVVLLVCRRRSDRGIPRLPWVPPSTSTTRASALPSMSRRSVCDCVATATVIATVTVTAAVLGLCRELDPRALPSMSRRLVYLVRKVSISVPELLSEFGTRIAFPLFRSRFCLEYTTSMGAFHPNTRCFSKVSTVAFSETPQLAITFIAAHAWSSVRLR